jgi:peptidoglycan hydrolase-like protein with peptidoglycan-binding domain
MIGGNYVAGIFLRRVWGLRVNSAIGHACILAGAGAAAVLMAWSFEQKPEAAAVVVTLPPQRVVEPSPIKAAHVLPPQPVAAASPTPIDRPLTPDRDSLGRQLQRELQRVGCYDGDINGVWNAASRRAMKSFTESANASLPTDQPDYILLRLVQGHAGQACGPTLAKAEPRGVEADVVPEPRSRALVERPAPTLVPAPVPAPRLRSEGSLAAAASRTDSLPEPTSRAAAPMPPPPTAFREGPVPPARVYNRTPRRWQRAGDRPPKFVRTFIRNVQRSLAPFGIP